MTETTDTTTTSTYSKADWLLAERFEGLKDNPNDDHIYCTDHGDGTACLLPQPLEPRMAQLEAGGACEGRGYVPSITLESLAEAMLGEKFYLENDYEDGERMWKWACESDERRVGIASGATFTDAAKEAAVRALGLRKVAE